MAALGYRLVLLNQMMIADAKNCTTIAILLSYRLQFLHWFLSFIQNLAFIALYDASH